MIWLGALAFGSYVMLGVHVGYEVAEGNRGVHPQLRLSPWLRGALWPFFVAFGFILILFDYFRASGASKPRR